MTESLNCKAAKRYSTLGWHIFPLKPKTKIPATPHGFHDATTTFDTLEGWWGENPTYGIGVATGEASGIFVVDVDPRNHGDDSLAELIKEYGPLPDTVESLTGGGGRHLFFRYVKGIGCSKPWPGIDIKGDGGYVAVPFTVHPSGMVYKWRKEHGPEPNFCPADPPSWLVAGVANNVKTPLAARSDPDARYPVGSRNSSLAAIAGLMRRYDLEPRSILAALLEENRTKCVPPLPESEVCSIAASISRYEPSATLAPADLPPVVRSIDLGTVYSDNQTPIPWAIKEWLVERDIAMLAGEPKLGKSTVLLDLAFSLLTGGKFLGLIAPTSTYRILYIDEEMNERMIRSRLARMARGRELTEQQLRALPLQYCFQNFLKLDNPKHLSTLRRKIEEFQPDWVLFDSMVRFHGADENDNSQMSHFFTSVLRPLACEAQAGLILLHHLNKPSVDRGAELWHRVRGAADLGAIVDEMWILQGKREEDSRKLSMLGGRWDNTPGDIFISYNVSDDESMVWLTSEYEKSDTYQLILNAIRSAGPAGIGRLELAALIPDTVNAPLRWVSRATRAYLERQVIAKKFVAKKVLFYIP